LRLIEGRREAFLHDSPRSPAQSREEMLVKKSHLHIESATACQEEEAAEKRRVACLSSSHAI